MNFKQFSHKLINITEKFLTKRKRKRLIKAEKQKRKHPVRDWIEAILWALFIVLLFQQFLFELYVIPTGSMIPTIEIGTRALVNKFEFGPEIIPGLYKFSIFRKPKRGEVVVFENPDKNLPKMGPLFKIMHNIIYRLSLTFINLDKDKMGYPRVRLLLKRVVGIPGERIRMRQGDVELLHAGEISWIKEEDMKKRLGISYPIRRINNHFNTDNTPLSSLFKYSELYAKHPDQKHNNLRCHKNNLGWYIPNNRFFPMGDNRDLSKDARVYGPVNIEKLLGKAIFRLWPIKKIGIIK